MSMSNDYEGDLGGLSEDEFLQMLIMSGLGGGQTPGSTPTNRLSYLKSFTDFLDVPLGAMFGQNEPLPEATPFMSEQRSIYGSPEWQMAFDAMDAGADPRSALKTAGMNENDTVLLEPLVKYGSERFKYGESQRQAMAGRRDFGTRNEYDLLGQPGEQDLIRQVAESRKLRRPTSSQVGMGGADRLAVNGPMGAQQQFQTERAAKARIKKAKNTEVRSDDNQNLMRRILALKAMLGD